MPLEIALSLSVCLSVCLSGSLWWEGKLNLLTISNFNISSLNIQELTSQAWHICNKTVESDSSAVFSKSERVKGNTTLAKF